MTRPDDLRPGIYVAVVGYSDSVLEAIEQQPSCDSFSYGLFVQPQPQKKKAMYSGSPLKVIRVSLPFCCVEHSNGKREALDLREVFVQRLDPAYARAMHGVTRKKRAKKRSASQMIQEGCCPKCHQQSLIQQIAPGRSKEWKKICRNADCGWREDGGDSDMVAFIIQ